MTQIPPQADPPDPARIGVRLAGGILVGTAIAADFFFTRGTSPPSPAPKAGPIPQAKPGADAAGPGPDPVVRFEPWSGEITVGPGLNVAGKNLRGARIAEADLTAANFDGADLYGARFSHCDLRKARKEVGSRYSRWELLGGRPRGLWVDSRPSPTTVDCVHHSRGVRCGVLRCTRTVGVLMNRRVQVILSAGMVVAAAGTAYVVVNRSVGAQNHLVPTAEMFVGPSGGGGDFSFFIMSGDRRLLLRGSIDDVSRSES